MAISTSFFTVDGGNEEPADSQSVEQNMSSPPERKRGRTASSGSVDQIKSEGGHGEHARSDDMAMKREESMMSEDTAMHDAPSPAGSLDPRPTATSSAAKTAAAKRRKGTATTVKPPKKARHPSAAKKKVAPGSSKSKPSPASLPGQPLSTEEGGIPSSPGESDSGPYCICRGPDNHRFMIACDRCEDWFHGECIGMDKYTGENLVQKYICPSCTENDRYTTRYKKMCSLSGCVKPARIYDEDEPSIFCSPEHCQTWWEQLIGNLPKTKNVAFDNLTQEEFMGLLDSSSSSSWSLGKPPFGIPPDFYTHHPPSTVLTPEELLILSRSATSRASLSSKIDLCTKMLQLLDMALSRREAAIASGRIPGAAKDYCGYDNRLIVVGTTYQFGEWLATPEGEAIFRDGKLEAPEGEEEGDPLTAGMCMKKKCKAHAGWGAILTKTVRHDMKEWAAEAKGHLEREQHVRASAARRWMRKQRERNSVEYLDGGSD